MMRYARNPNIARVCADMRYGQELGEGIRRMFDQMRREGLADPVYAHRLRPLTPWTTYLEEQTAGVVLVLAVSESPHMRFFMEEFSQMGDVGWVPSQSVTDGIVPGLPHRVFAVSVLRDGDGAGAFPAGGQG
ncbi:MAG: hypothetical protein F4Z79_00690 [Acidimicrobiia bacterium]|nr:hypothetical protein [Acidimicrobiia bacterium]MXY74585.1 hypothetical protein [Acidimicrobiia bacterium]MYA38079.1 hypothetical protein [Acidimicrobiia bacterium]MYB79413.1 hypothetical protein [Acidimicrobiia bacterium]MYD40634.1 hypothetical protein [Acidimicrobiia bacterium]